MLSHRGIFSYALAKLRWVGWTPLCEFFSPGVLGHWGIFHAVALGWEVVAGLGPYQGGGGCLKKNLIGFVRVDRSGGKGFA